MRGMFDGIVQGLVTIGIAIGLAIAAIGYGVFSVVKHITIGWH